MKVHVETVLGPNPWAIHNGTQAQRCPNCGGQHCCYFCQEDGCYEPMPKGHTLCARCSELIFVPELDDPMNEAMVVCEGCEKELTERACR